MTPNIDPIPGHETIDGETLYKNEIKRLKEALSEKEAVIAHYRVGIDDLLNALRPHADGGDVEAGNIMASLLSIKRTANKAPTKETKP